MNRGQWNLLAIGCLLIFLAPVQAQQAKPRRASNGQVLGFVPKHEKIQRLRQSPRIYRSANASGVDATQNPFAIPVQRVDSPTPISTAASPSANVEQISYDQQIIATSYPPSAGCQCDDCSVDSFGGVPSCGAPTCGASHCGTPCGGGCYQPIFWVGAEYLLWGTREADSPALATTSVANTVREAAGVLDEPGVSTLFGGNGMHGDVRSGARFTLGGWFSPARTSGVQVSYFSFEEDEESFSGNLIGFPILARPFFNTTLFEEDSRLINFPNVVSGELAIRSTSDFNSLEIMFLKPASQSRGVTNLMFGYRNANLDESIRFDETTTSLVSPTLDSTFVLSDEFDVENSFHGGQIAFHHVGSLGNCWSFDFLGKASLGSTRSRIRIDGQTTTTTSTGDTSTADGGLMALGTNMGSHSDSEFGSLFELGCNLRRRFQNGLQFKVGYTFLHWSSVARAVEQIDRDINRTQVPPDTLVGLPTPGVPFERSGFWAQGLNLGLEYQF